MRYLILFLLQLSCFIAKAQTDEMELLIKKNDTAVRSYTIYWYPSVDHFLKPYRKEKTPKKRVVLENGREKEITYYYNGRIFSNQQNFYQDTLLEKSIIQYTKSKPAETTHYTYDTATKEVIRIESYEKGKRTYSWSVRKIGDTTETRTIYSSNLMKGKERELVYYTNNGLTENTILFQDHWQNPAYTTKKYDQYKRLVEQFYRHEEDTTITHYQYDAQGRLVHTASKRHNFVDYTYGEKEIIAEEYETGPNQNTLIQKKVIKRYDAEGNLTEHEILEYYKDEWSARKPPVATAHHIRKYNYVKGRLCQVEETSKDGFYDCYEIQYRFGNK